VKTHPKGASNIVFLSNVAKHLTISNALPKLKFTKISSPYSYTINKFFLKHKKTSTKMSNLEKIIFKVLAIDGLYYLAWC
jgi:hypothetical protein